MAKVTVYHVWGKTLAGRKIQLDTDKEPRLGKPIRIGGTLCEVTDFAEYQLEDRTNEVNKYIR